MKIKTVRCKSGIMGWQAHLRDIYASFEEFAAYAETYGVPKRLGYKNPKTAWKGNPLIQGSVIPSDYRRVRK
jgi:ABC-type uncharacterized transport system YnjBCD substrate-binding protein